MQWSIEGVKMADNLQASLPQMQSNLTMAINLFILTRARNNCSYLIDSR